MFFRRVFNHNKDTYPSPNPKAMEKINHSDNNSDASSDVGISSAVDKVRLNHRSSADNNRMFNVIQLTPLWEHVIRTGRLPEGLGIPELFDEFSERLNDPEWQVRQHALRVLVDVLIILGPRADAYFAPLVAPLVDNLGHAAPAVRKGSLDALRVYIGESRLPENVLCDVIDLGMNGGSDSLYGGRLTVGVMLCLPALIQVTLTHPKRRSLVQTTVNALMSKIGDVNYQEIALKILLRIKEMVGEIEFYDCVPISSQNDFNILCDVYGLKQKGFVRERSTMEIHRDSGVGLSLPSSSESSQPWNKTYDGFINRAIQDSNRPATVLPEVREKRENHSELDNEIRWKINSSCSGRSPIMTPRKGTPNSQQNESCSSSIIGSSSTCPLTHVNENELPSGKVIMETEIQLSDETAVTMRILEADTSTSRDLDTEEEDTIVPTKSSMESTDSMKTSQATSYEGFDDNLDANRRSTPKRVHFGGEVIKIRTPDSESVAQSDADDHIRPITFPQPRSPFKVLDMQSSKSSSTTSLSIEIPQDNTKPLSVKERPKTAANLTSSRGSTDSINNVGTSDITRTKSASPKHRRRLSLGSRLDAIISPQGPHTPMEMMYNLQRSPLASPIKATANLSPFQSGNSSTKPTSFVEVENVPVPKKYPDQPPLPEKISLEETDIISRDVARHLKSAVSQGNRRKPLNSW